MTNIPRDWDLSEYKDVETQNYLARVQIAHPNDPKALAKALDGISKVSRDHARTPMQWDATPHGGFTKAKKPWMRANDNYTEINAELQEGDKDSPLEFWRGMLRVRKGDLEMYVHGRFEGFEMKDERTVIYSKVGGNKERVLVVLNFTGERQEWRVPEGWKVGECLAGNVDGNDREERALQAWEGRLYKAGLLNLNGVNGHA